MEGAAARGIHILCRGRVKLAQLIGRSRESVTRTLSDFKRQKLVELNGSTLLVWNKAALETIATV
jgi:CRP-like cAMP-binding protein